ncbi:hypothetical protein RQP46_010999 [Phenoliferia psychrophenolica]
MLQAALLSFALLSVASAQQVGTQTAEVHPSLTIEECTAGGTCTTIDSSIVLDGNWRWTHDVSGYTNCYTGNSWSTTLCPDPETCTTNCALDGADYESTYGITTTGSSVTLDFVTGSNVGSRVYLMDENDENYRLFQLKNQEFTFDVDVSNLPCGLNGALYMAAMDADGGLSEYSTNKAGAKYGTGYCDAQCPHDIKFINGQANSQNWTGTDANSGTGHYGSCCMDIWEANKISTAVTPHVCSVQGQTRCEGIDCGDTASGERDDGICDKDGCDFNPYRLGDHSFFGPDMTVDTSKVMTVVTQFVTSDNTSTGTLSEIRRLYVQDGTVIGNSVTSNLPTEYDSITDDFCNAQKTTFGDTNQFETIGGLATMGDALETGLVLVMSLWDDSAAEMLWLDSDYPVTSDASTAGVARGTCATTSGVPSDVRSASPGSSVTFSNIKFGPIGSTYSGTAAVASSSSATVFAATSSTAAVASSSKIVTSVKTSATTEATTSSAKAATSSKAVASSSKATTSSAVKVTSTAPATSSAVQQTTSAAVVAKTTSTAAAATTSSAAAAATSSTSTSCAVAYAQCGGINFIGSTCCPSGWSCTDYNPYYSQCTQD